jgi:predicted Zn-dependent protease
MSSLPRSKSSALAISGNAYCIHLPGFWPVTSGLTVCSNLVRETPPSMDRIAALNEVLTQNPKDAFARYGLAMEYSRQGDFDRALAEFALLLENHPDYTAGYFMAAQTLVRAERSGDAKQMLQEGIASARRTGNLHAQSEMEALLAELQ